MLVRGLGVVRRDGDDGRVRKLSVRPRLQVGQPGLLAGLAQRDGQRVALARIPVPADLQPGPPAVRTSSRIRSTSAASAPPCGR
jgi:hypothetical protein